MTAPRASGRHATARLAPRPAAGPRRTRARAAARPEPTRERILAATTRLVQRRGYHAVSTAEILAETGAPRGSMYHHFPNGKEQIVVEAIGAIQAAVVDAITTLHTRQLRTDEMIRKLLRSMARWLEASGWQEGTMLASATVGAVPDLPRVHAAIRGALEAWRGHLAECLVREHWSAAAARAMAQTILAGMEGAMILARIDQDARIAHDVGETLARLVAAGPPGPAPSAPGK